MESAPTRRGSFGGASGAGVTPLGARAGTLITGPMGASVATRASPAGEGKALIRAGRLGLGRAVALSALVGLKAAAGGCDFAGTPLALAR